MSLLPWVLLFLLAVLEAWLFAPLAADIAESFKEWRRRRDVVRRSAADQEIRARRAAQQLSLMAWRARHEMYDLASQGRSTRSVRLERHDAD